MKSSLFLIFIASFIITSCCTRKDCLRGELPAITVHLDGYNDSETGYVIVKNEVSGLQVDSFQFYHNIISILNHSSSFIKENSYFIHSDNSRIDTVLNIKYQIHTETIKCNDCFLKKDLVEVSSPYDFSFIVNGETNTTSSVTIYK